MIFENLSIIEACKDDFSALKRMRKASRRVLNTKRGFSSPLMVSAHQLKHLNKIDELPCDAVIINLEDGVAPEHKMTALHLAALFITHLDQCQKKIIVRVNPLDEGGEKEIRFLNDVRVDAIRIPKVRTRKDVDRGLKLIKNGAELHLSIETKEAWRNLPDLVGDERVTAAYLGILDLFADMGFSQSLIEADNPMMHYLLSHFIVTAKTGGSFPVSFVYQDYKDLEGLKRWLELERRLGYTSKGVVSPDQAKIVGAFYAADEERISRARYIVRRFEEEAKKGVTGFADDRYGFIDEPIYKGALIELGSGKS